MHKRSLVVWAASAIALVGCFVPLMTLEGTSAAMWADYRGVALVAIAFLLGSALVPVFDDFPGLVPLSVLTLLAPLFVIGRQDGAEWAIGAYLIVAGIAINGAIGLTTHFTRARES